MFQNVAFFCSIEATQSLSRRPSFQTGQEASLAVQNGISHWLGGKNAPGKTALAGLSRIAATVLSLRLLVTGSEEAAQRMLSSQTYSIQMSAISPTPFGETLGRLVDRRAAQISRCKSFCSRFRSRPCDISYVELYGCPYGRAATKEYGGHPWKELDA